jgi:uncharacterized protein YndB with AHSA1/START domain
MDEEQLSGCVKLPAMEPVRVQRDVELELPLDELWALVSEKEGLAAWLGDEVDVDLRPGGEGSIVDDGVLRRVRVDRVDEGRLVGFTWWRDDDPGEASHVVIEVVPSRGGGHVRITETISCANGTGTDAGAVTGAEVRWGLRALLLWRCTACGVRV